MDAIYRKVTPQEAYELQSMFPDVQVDYTQFKVYSDNYTQSTKTSCDTANDTRCEFYIPPKATIIKSWQIEADVKCVGSTGALPAIVPAATAGAAMILDSGPSCIERFQVLHGNGAGDILHEVTNHAHALFKMRMQGKHDASEYGCYIVDDDLEGSAVALGGAVRTEGGIMQISGPADDANILPEYESQLAKIQRERQMKYKKLG